jgi:predicted membrane channel-forming protein YqfA (hemolysin III family)
MSRPRHSSYFRPGVDKENKRIHVVASVLVCALATVLALVAWDYMATHGVWVLWAFPACALVLLLAWRKPWIALGLWLGLRH